MLTMYTLHQCEGFINFFSFLLGSLLQEIVFHIFRIAVFNSNMILINEMIVKSTPIKESKYILLKLIIIFFSLTLFLPILNDLKKILSFCYIICNLLHLNNQKSLINVLNATFLKNFNFTNYKRSNNNKFKWVHLITEK